MQSSNNTENGIKVENLDQDVPVKLKPTAPDDADNEQTSCQLMMPLKVELPSTTSTSTVSPSPNGTQPNDSLTGQNSYDGNIDYDSDEDEDEDDDYTRSSMNNQQKQNDDMVVIPFYISLAFFVFFLVYFYGSSRYLLKSGVDNKITFDELAISDLKLQYPNYMSDKKVKLIKNRLKKMTDGISVLMLLGHYRDIKCKVDPTFCISRCIANSTQYGYGYLDASVVSTSRDIDYQFETTFNKQGSYIIVIDGLERLPGSEAQSLLSYVDSDSARFERGMIVLTVYAGDSPDMVGTSRPTELVENILVDRWSKFLGEDRLSPILSRITGSIIKVV